MTLTTAGKDYIAEHFGLSNCFVKTGLSWTRYDLDGTNTAETGGTVKLVNRITETSVVDYILIDTTEYYYSDLKAANGGYDVTLDDITWIAAHDESSDSPPNPYCKTAAATGFLSVTTAPADALGASVDIDGKDCGDTQVVECEVPVGTNKTVTITKTGYQTETRTVDITEGNITDLDTITMTEIPVGEGTLCVLTDPDLASVYVDIDKNPDPNPDLSPSRKEPPWKCTEVAAAARPEGTPHTVTAKKAGYKDEEVTAICFEGETRKITIPMEPEAGPTVGIVELHAFNAKTDAEINANFDIKGIGGEEKYLTPKRMNIKEGTCDWIRFYCTGFEDYEATNITIEEGKTTTVNAYMTPKKLWQEVYVGPPIILVVLEDFDIPSRLYWTTTYDFSVTLRCFEAGWYYANIELREPGTFLTTGDPADLGATKWTIPLPEKEIEFFDINTKVEFETTDTVPGAATVPKGTYIAIVTAYSGKR